MSQPAGPRVVDPPRSGTAPGSSEGRGRRTARPTFPVSFVEEIFLGPTRKAEPPTILLELRVAGSLDESRLRDALGVALAVHPMAGARLARGRFLLRRAAWEVVEPGGIDLAPAVEVARCDDDPAMGPIRAAMSSRAIDLLDPPPLRLLVVHRPGGDSLLAAFHHAMTDGIGAVRLLNSIARAYSGQPDPVPDVDPLTSRDVFKHLTPAAPGRPEDAPPRARETGRAAPIVPAGSPEQRGTAVCCEELPAGALERLDPRRFGPGTSLNDLLLAAGHLAVARWNAERGRPSDGVAIMVPMNLRPKAWVSEVVANIVYSDRNVSVPADRASPEALVAAVSAQMTRLKLGIEPPRLFRRPPWAFWLITQVLGPLMIYRKIRPPRGAGSGYSLILSNLGRIEPKVSGFGPEAGPITDFWFAPPISGPIGAGIGTCTLGGRLHLMLRYSLSVFDDRSARAFVALFFDQLSRLGR